MADPISVSAAEYERLKKADELLKKILPVTPKPREDWHCLTVAIGNDREPRVTIIGKKVVLSAAITMAARRDPDVSDIIKRIIRIFVTEDEA